MSMSRQRQEMVELPADVIQHIQSFMRSKAAAQASSLCKSWYYAWSTQPVVHFYYYSYQNQSLFWDFVKKRIDRYINLNLKVEKLIVKVANSSDVAFLRKLIVVDAVKLRVNALEFSFHGYSVPPVQGVQVFANKYLTDLYLVYCNVGRLISENVLCSKLRTLRLQYVSIDDNSFKDILAQSPILESLTMNLMDCNLPGINASELHNLKILVVEPDIPISSSVIKGRFLNLTRMVLIGVIVDGSFLKNLSSTFPNLEDLTLGKYWEDKNIHISSRSVKCLSLKHYGKLWKMANIDLPNIIKFSISGYPVPLRFTASSEEWKSEIILSDYCRIKLSKLRDLLMQLRQSKISLRLNIGNVSPERDTENFILSVVEELTYYTTNNLAYSFFMEYLSCFRPKVVSFVYRSDTKVIPFLYKNLIEQRNQRNSLLSINYVDKVKVERFEEPSKKWLPIRVSKDDFDILNHGAERLRFVLKWGSLTPEKTIIKFVQYNPHGSLTAEE